MDIRPIRTEQDYEAVLAEVSGLIDLNPEIGTPEGDCREKRQFHTGFRGGVCGSVHSLQCFRWSRALA